LKRFKEEKFMMTAHKKLLKFNSKIFISIQKLLNKLVSKRIFDILYEKYSKGNDLFRME
jgi:hypothetical protein